MRSKSLRFTSRTSSATLASVCLPEYLPQRTGAERTSKNAVMAKFAECHSLLKKTLSGRSADQKRIQHCQTKAKTLQKEGL